MFVRHLNVLFSCQICMFICMYVCMYVCRYACMYKSFLKTTTNSSCVCTHLANKADSDSDSDSDVFAEFRFIFVKRSCSRRDSRKRIIVFFIL